MGGTGMAAAQRAFLEAQVALSAWRAAKDAEAWVEHWLVDGSLLLGVVNNPSNSLFAITAQWLWAYHDGLLVNRAGISDAPAATYSVESGPTSNPAQGGGGPGTQTTGVININSGADPYLTLDPTISCGTVAGVNQMAGYVADNAGAVLPLHVELQYSPLYLYPR